MISDELVKKLRDYPAFQEFSEYLVAKIEELDTVSDLEGKNREQAGEEALVRAKARNKLYEILAPFMLGDKKEPTKEQIDKAKEKFGL